MFVLGIRAYLSVYLSMTNVYVSYVCVSYRCAVVPYMHPCVSTNIQICINILHLSVCVPCLSEYVLSVSMPHG